MPRRIKVRQIQTSLMPNEVKRLIQFGHEQDWKRGNTVSMGGTMRKIVQFVLRLRRHEKVDAYLKRKGGSLWTLIETSVISYCDKNL